jgi:hypothetical protein
VLQLRNGRVLRSFFRRMHHLRCRHFPVSNRRQCMHKLPRGDVQLGDGFGIECFLRELHCRNLLERGGSNNRFDVQELRCGHVLAGGGVGVHQLCNGKVLCRRRWRVHCLRCGHFPIPNRRKCLYELLGR